MSKVLGRNESGKFVKAGATAPAYNPTEAAKAVRDEYFDVDIDEGKLLEAAEKGQDVLEAFAYGLKLGTIKMAVKGIPKESANPYVVLRNTGTEDCLVKAGRYGKDFDDVCPVKTKDGGKKMGKVARRKNDLIRDDPLAREGLTNLNLKVGTFFKCRVSLARLIKDQAGQGGLVIEAYDPDKHDKRVGKAITLGKDPSINAGAAGAPKSGARFVGPEEFGDNTHSSVSGDPEDGKVFNVPDAPIETEFNRFKPVE